MHEVALLVTPVIPCHHHQNNNEWLPDIVMPVGCCDDLFKCCMMRLEGCSIMCEGSHDVTWCSGGKLNILRRKLDQPYHYFNGNS